MNKCEIGDLSMEQIEELLDELESIVDAFKKYIKKPDSGEFAVYDSHEGFKTIRETELVDIYNNQFKKPAFTFVEDVNLGFVYDEYLAFAIENEDYIYGKIIWGKVIDNQFVGLDAEDFSEIASQMFLRQSAASVDDDEFYLYRFIGGDEVCVDLSH